MSTTRRCDGCSIEVSVPNEVAGREPACPECGAIFSPPIRILVTDADAGLRLGGPRKRIRLISRETTAVALCVAIVAISAETPLLAGEPKVPAKKAVAATPDIEEMIPDRGWIPKAGDEVSVHSRASFGVNNLSDYGHFEKFDAAGDMDGMKPHIDKGAIAILPIKTRVLIIKRYPSRTAYSSGGMSAEQAGDRLQAVMLQPAKRDPVEVRVMDGEFKGRLFFMPEDHLAKLIPRPQVVNAKKPAYQPKAVDPKARLATLMKSAQNTEKNGKRKGAAQLYQQVIDEYPNSGEAKIAGEKLKGLK